MANYTAADIKALRERTGAGMLDVKKALDEAGGDAEKALEIIRVKGLKGVAKREGRSTSEGLMQRHSGKATGTEAEPAAEPLAEWERELLAGAEAPAEVVAETAAEAEVVAEAPVEEAPAAEAEKAATESE